ncbi:ribonuclease H-like domain-containing protein [Tanacetum coccineum]
MFKHSIHQSMFRRGILGAALYVLHSAFSTTANPDLTWNMDTGASSHLNSYTSNLNTVYNKCLYPSVCVGDGKSIPVTNTGHNMLPTLNRPLHLDNVLVTPNIIKNLISVCQFTRDNNCIVEFDAFGFSVKDFLIRHILLRCDSSGDLYPVTSPSLTPHVLLFVSPNTWHQRLGHPGEDVLRSLKSRQYKARLVANGHSQQFGVDCDDTFSPVVKPATVRMPPGFVDARFPHHVCRLQRSLYGLKQAPRAWFQRFAGYTNRVGFSSSRSDSSLFIYQHGFEVAYLLIYVDDIVLTISSTDLLQRIISSLHKEFDMADLGALNYFLGISVTRDSTGMFMSQKKYALVLLDRAHMANCNPTRTPVT